MSRRSTRILTSDRPAGASAAAQEDEEHDGYVSEEDEDFQGRASDDDDEPVDDGIQAGELDGLRADAQDILDSRAPAAEPVIATAGAARHAEELYRSMLQDVLGSKRPRPASLRPLTHCAAPFHGPVLDQRKRSRLAAAGALAALYEPQHAPAAVSAVLNETAPRRLEGVLQLPTPRCASGDFDALLATVSSATVADASSDDRVVNVVPRIVRPVEERFKSAAAAAVAATRGGKVTITQRVKYAGQVVNVTKRVTVAAAAPVAAGVPVALDGGVATSSSSTLSAVVTSLDKGEGISTLTKSSLDWDSYKQAKGIEEELERATKAGYVEKQGFLQRVDERTFEVERAARAVERARAEAAAPPQRR